MVRLCNSFKKGRSKDETIVIISILFLISRFANAATNNSLTDDQLLQIKFDQKLNSQISPDLAFRDETGNKFKSEIISANGRLF